ncbi:MAG: hypothetical protein E6Q73_02835, partial [Pseudorhodobacter sp.]
MANLPPTISGPIIATLSEDSFVAWVSAVTNVYDPDTFVVRAENIPALPPGITYDLTFSAFVIDSHDAAWQFLGAGMVTQVILSYTVTDGEFSVPHTLVVNMLGVNDEAVIGGTSAAFVGEDGVAVSELLTVSDADVGEAAFHPELEPLQGAYGSFTLTAAGRWTYTLTPGNAAVQALGAGETLSESFVAVTLDGTEQVVTVTILGADEPTITGTAAADVLIGTAASEMMFGLGGNDNLQCNYVNDTLDSGTGADSLYGG